MKSIATIRTLRTVVRALVLALLSLSTPALHAQEKILHTFTGKADGGAPFGGIALDSSGNAYATTSQGGAFGLGTVFKMTLGGKEVVLHDFAGGTDGAHPYGGLVVDSQGFLWGTTSEGGGASGCFGNGCGTLFKISFQGAYTMMYAFTGGTDGGLPYSSLTIDPQTGGFFGFTAFGGDLGCPTSTFGCGELFKASQSGTVTPLYSFMGGKDGAFPLYGSLGLDSANGILYGATQKGGDLNCNPPAGCGTTFSYIEAMHRLRTLHRFTGGKDGEFPLGGASWDATGRRILGTASGGGGAGWHGTIYGIDGVTDILTVIHGFHRTTDGSTPVAGVSIDPNGNLYITTELGGKNNNGALIKVDTTGKETVFHSLNISVDGGNPNSTFSYDQTCACLIGTTENGGSTQNGGGFGTFLRFKWKP